MVTIDPAPLGDAAVAIASPTLAAGSLAAIGLLGVTDWILGEDEPPESPDESGGGSGSGLFDEAETAGDGGVVDDGGDEFDFDDDGDDAFDEFDVGGMDEEDGGGGGAKVLELETRVEEMEDELSSISSTVGTVRTENEQISESVDDIEENVRKLLDIYKMVTKGVNPFVDEDGGGGMPGGQGASLGLFDQDDEEGEEQPENLDPDVTDADAEEFFDDDFEEDEEYDATEEEESSEEDPDESMAQSEDGSTEEEGGAKSFDELREEYEEGADWSEEAEEATDEAADAEATEDALEAEAQEEAVEEEEEPLDAAPPEEETEDDDVDDECVDGLFDEDAEQQAEEASARQPAPQPAARPEPRAPPRGGARPQARGEAGEKPYLRELPSGYVSDLLVMEWVEFLVTESSPSGAHRAVTYYENVGWLGRRAADQLREFVDGHPEATVDDADDGASALTMDHHTTSLRYVARITGDVQENVLAAWDEGDNRWLQH